MTREDAIREAANEIMDPKYESDDELARTGFVVGLHPVFGWVYRHPGDEGGIHELTDTFRVSSFGEEPAPQKHVPTTSHEEAVALLRVEFPDYPVDALPDMSDIPGLEPQFWHNETAPTWCVINDNDDALITFCADYPDPTMRECYPDEPRYAAWYNEPYKDIIATDDLAVAKAALHEAIKRVSR